LEERRNLQINDFKFACTPFRVRTEKEAGLVSLIGNAPDSELLNLFEIYELASQETDIQETAQEFSQGDFDFSEIKHLLE
jgi:hypothetical protein